MGTENEESCSQRDSAECEEYVRTHRSFNRIWKERDSAEPDVLGRILNKDNLNRAYKRVKANKGAPGVDGMTIEAALPWLKEHNHELVEKIRRGKYTPSPVRRVEIPKPDGGVRKLGRKLRIKLRRLTSRSKCGSIIKTMGQIKVYMRGWLNYYGIADMKRNIEDLNGWLYRRIRICIWKQWKQPKTRKRKLIGLGLLEWVACEGAYSRKSYWWMSNVGVIKRALAKQRLINWRFYDLSTAYQSLHINY